MFARVMASPEADRQREYVCDLCGARMAAHACKVTCPNCGYRFDCSDLTLNFEEPVAQSASSKLPPADHAHPP